MTDRQCVTVNIHNPHVKSIRRLEGTGKLSIELGNDEYHGRVAILTDTAEWLEVAVAVRKFLQTETDDELSCKYCWYPATDRDDMTEHVFAYHPDGVAR